VRAQQAADAADKVLNERPSHAPALRMKMATSGLLGRMD
jgi:hypothetical protein